MLALALAAAITSADLQQWIDDQPEVRAYEAQRQRPPADDAFRLAPRLPQRTACESRSHALAAAVKLFKISDAARLTLTEPDLQAKNGGHAVLVLNEQGKKALTDRAERYEKDAGLYEPACLG